jgi:serine kinase of HPr protein (carbohydrate metabolism regulator)
MNLSETPTIHASAVLVGRKAVLIRGPAGSGKSQLAFALIEAAAAGTLNFARLVADDRTHVEACGGRLLAHPAPALAGLIEVRGLGIRRLPYEPLAAVGLAVDLHASDADRHPLPEVMETTIEGVTLPRLPIAAGQAALPLLLGFLRSLPAAD